MKVLMVSRWLWDERRRNGNKTGFFGELAQAVVARGVDLTILSQIDGAGGIPERRPIDGLNVHVFSRTGRKPLLVPFDKLIKFLGGYRKAVTDAYVIRRFVREHGPFDALVAQCEEPDGLACALSLLAGGMPPLVTILPSPGRATEYMLGLKNFYVLTRYNRSFFYALAVYQLGQRVKAQMEASDAASAVKNATPPVAASQ